MRICNVRPTNAHRKNKNANSLWSKLFHTFVKHYSGESFNVYGIMKAKANGDTQYLFSQVYLKYSAFTHNTKLSPCTCLFLQLLTTHTEAPAILSSFRIARSLTTWPQRLARLWVWPRHSSLYQKRMSRPWKSEIGELKQVICCSLS